MKHALFEAQLRAGERFHSAQIPPNHWAILRADGRSFSKFTARRFQKPFDARFHELMVESAATLFREFGALYGATHSDEISIFLPLDFSIFDRQHEKLVSVAAGLVSAHFSAKLGEAAHFDARIWVGKDIEAVVDYFRWRQSDGIRCALSGAVYHHLRAQNQTARAATRFLEGLSREEKLQFLRENGAAFESLPVWAQRGVGLVNGFYSRPGVDPIRRETVQAARRRITVLEHPVGQEFGNWLHEAISKGKVLA